MNVKTFRLIALSVAVTFLAACGGSEEPVVPETNDTIDTTPVVEEDVEVEVMDYMLPSPLQIALIFNHAGLEYAPGLTNDVSNAENYVSKTSKMLNFGAYSADLSYSVVNNENEAALAYMGIVKDLSDDLGLGSIFNSEALMSKFERNLSNQDTLIEILTELQEKLDEYVDDNDERFMHVTIFAGAWIESMHLGYRSTEDPNVGRKLMEQMTILDNICIGLSKNPDNDEYINTLVTELQAARAIYNDFEAIKSLEEEEDADFSLIEISPEELKALGEKMEQIRASFVEV